MAITLTFAIPAVLAIIGGIIILIWKRALSVVVGLWLLIYGILQLVGLSGMVPGFS